MLSMQPSIQPAPCRCGSPRRCCCYRCNCQRCVLFGAAADAAYPAYSPSCRYRFPHLCLRPQVNGSGTHPIYQILKAQQPVSLPSSFGPPLPGEPGRIEWK